MTEALPVDPRGDTMPDSGRQAPQPSGRMAHWLIWPRMAWPWEILTVLIGDAAYEVIRALAPQHQSEAFHNARLITDLEPLSVRAWENWLQDLVNGHHWLQVLFGGYYAILHLTVTVGVLGWLWWCRPGHYPRARTVLFVLTFGALVVFWAFPVAPPRLAVPGAVDTVGNILLGGPGAAAQNGGAAADSGALGLVNPYAAFPSLHVAWAAWCAWAVWAGCAVRLRWTFWLYPVATTMVVVGTANHYLIDVLAGIGALTLAIVACAAPAAAAPATAAA